METDGKLDHRWVLIARQKQNWRPWWNLDVNVSVKRRTGIGDRCETRSQMGVDLNVIARQKHNWRPWWNLDVNVIVEKKNSTQKT